MNAKTIERIEGSDLYDKFLTIGENMWIVAVVAWFAWTFGDGVLWIVVFGAGFYIGNIYHRNNDPEDESCPLTQ